MAPPLQPGVLGQEVAEQDQLRVRELRLQGPGGIQISADPPGAAPKSQKFCQVIKLKHPFLFPYFALSLRFATQMALIGLLYSVIQPNMDT